MKTHVESSEHGVKIRADRCEKLAADACSLRSPCVLSYADDDWFRRTLSVISGSRVRSVKTAGKASARAVVSS